MTATAELNEHLASDIGALCEALGIEINRAFSTRREIRAGRKGSLAIEVARPKAGTWFDHEAQVGGGPLKLIEHHLGCDWRAAQDWARNFLGIGDAYPPAPVRKPKPKLARVDENANRSGRIRKAQIKYDAGVPVEGSPAETYLQSRNIMSWPDTLRWWPNATRRYGGLVVPAIDAEGEIKAVQIIYLTADGTKAPLDVPKRSYGGLKGAAFRIPGNPPIILAEGPETALSVWLATGCETLAVLGISNFANAPIDPGHAVTIAADDFELGSQAEKATHNAARALAARGGDVRLTHLPPGGGDFNKIHQRDGLDAVREIIDAAEPWVEPAVAPLYLPPTGTIEQARTDTINFVSEWGKAAIEYWRSSEEPSQAGTLPPFPSVYSLRTVTGGGKSTAFRNIILTLVREKPEGTAIYGLFPTRRLFDEQAEELRKELGIDAEIRVATYRGITADDPQAPGHRMCRIVDFADTVRRGGAVIRHLCGTIDPEGRETLCVHFDICGRQREIREAQNADVIFAAHNHAVHRVPNGFPKPAAVASDESPINSLIVGLNGPARTLSLESIKHHKQIPSMASGIDYELSADLAALKESLVRILDKQELRVHPAQGPVSGPISTASLISAGITAEEAHDAHVALLRLKREIKTYPNMNKEDRTEAISIAYENMRLFLEARLWKIIGSALERNIEILPGLRVEMAEMAHHQFKVLRLRWREEIHEDWKVPTLLMDATAQWELYKPFWPFIDRVGTFDAAAPYMSFRQVLWSASASKLDGNGKTEKNNRRRVSRYIEARAVGFKRVLVLCQQKLETELVNLGLPINVEIAHFNNLRGIDKWKNVDLVIVIGRTQGPPEAVEMKAEVLFDRVPSRGEEWADGTYYPKRRVGLTGNGSAVEMEYHPDPQAEAVRKDICESELDQSVGRPRPVNRGPEDPLQVDYIGLVPLPFPVDEVLEWEEAQADPRDLMRARGVVFDISQEGANPVIQALLPDLFANDQAVRDWKRGAIVESANDNIIISESHNWPTAPLLLPKRKNSVQIFYEHGLWRYVRDGEELPEKAKCANLLGRMCVLEPLVPEELRDGIGWIVK